MGSKPYSVAARWLFVLVSAGAGVGWPGPAPVRADGPGDGLYGRFDGDLALTVGAGGGATWAEGRTAGNVVGELRLRIVDSAGVFLSGRWGPDAAEHVAAGIELRPLFAALFLQNSYTGHEFLDLLIQSLGLELGVAFSPLDDRIGVGLAAGGGVEVPLVPPSVLADGLWLRVGVRYVHTSPSYQSGPDVDADEWTLYATLAFKIITGRTVSGWEPQRYRFGRPRSH